jgi:hypothetical protein
MRSRLGAGPVVVPCALGVKFNRPGRLTYRIQVDESVVPFFAGCNLLGEFSYFAINKRAIACTFCSRPISKNQLYSCSVHCGPARTSGHTVQTNAVAYGLLACLPRQQ